MSDNSCFGELPVEFLSEFQDKLRFAEEKYRYTTNPREKIVGLLKEMALFYDADRAFLVEIDWDLGVGVCTYAHCDEGIEPQRDVMQQIPVEHFSLWVKKIRANQPVIMNLDLLKERIEEKHRATWNGLKIILIAPFSNRFNTGLIAIGNPKRHGQNLTFLLLLGYAVVSALNEIKLQERVDVAVKQIFECPKTEINISCFGGLTIKSSKGILTDDNITADQCYRLLAYLICNYRKARPVRELADIIWNDAPISDPYRDLKNVVYRLKRFLSIVELDDLVIGSGGTFIINPKYKIITDFDRFEEVCRRFHTEEEPQARSRAFCEAREIYTGLLLPRCDHVHWFIPRIGYYQTLYLNLMKKQLLQDLSNGKYLLVQKTAMEGLDAEPYDTDFLTYQIIAMFALGNRSMARSYFKRVEIHLSEEQKTQIESYANRKDG